MKIGSKVEFLIGCVGENFAYDEGQVVTVTHNNIGHIESQHRGGHCIELVPIPKVELAKAIEAGEVRDVEVDEKGKETFLQKKSGVRRKTLKPE